MEFKASHRYARMSARKVRYVADQIRGQSVDRALSILNFSPKRAAALVQKVVESAKENAENFGESMQSDLLVGKVWVDEGPTLKRWRPRAMGRATPIHKRTCHINVVLAGSGEEDGE